MGFFSIINFPLRYRRNPRMRLQLDDLTTGLNTGDAAADLGDAETQLSRNALMNQQGLVLQRRGSIKRLYNSSTLNGLVVAGFWTPRLGVYDGAPPTSGSPLQPYFTVGNIVSSSTTVGGMFGQGGSTVLQSLVVGNLDDAYSGTVNTSYGFWGLSLTQPAMFNDRLVNGAANYLGNYVDDNFVPLSISQYGGSTAMQGVAMAGAATLTNGSTTVSVTTLPTGLTTAQLPGLYIIVPADSTGANRMAYKVLPNGKLDRPYAGTTGAGKVIRILPAGGVHSDTGTFASGFVRACHVTSWQGRLITGNLDEGTASLSVDTSGHKPNRIRWSGVYDPVHPQAYPLSSTLLTDVHAWHPQAYLDVTPAFGAIRGLQVFGSSLMVFQQRGITILNGAPAFTGVGTIDQSTVFPGFSVLPWSFCETPYGVFFYDRNRGLFLWTGTGQPKQVSDQRLSEELFKVFGAAPTTPDVGPSLGFLGPDHLVVTQPFSASRYTNGDNQQGYLLYIKTNAWTRLDCGNSHGYAYFNNGSPLGQVFPGRSSVRGERLIGWGPAQELAGVGNVLDSAGGDSSYDLGASTYVFTSEAWTKLYGPENTALRPRRLDVTWQWGSVDDGSASGVYVFMGQAAASSIITDGVSTVDATSPGGVFTTKHKLMKIGRGTHIMVQVEGRHYPLTVREVIVEGFVAQEQDS